MKNILALSLLLIIAGCTPVYENVYHPPTTEKGRMCANQCIQLKRECRHNCTYHKNQCLGQKNTSQIINNALSVFLGGDKESVKDTDTTYCDRGEKKCTHLCNDEYDMCYTNCGGQVEKDAKCVENCEESLF